MPTNAEEIRKAADDLISMLHGTASDRASDLSIARVEINLADERSENERREFKTEEDYESFLMKENQKIRRRERERRHVDDPGKERCDVCNSVISYEGSCTCCQDW